MSAWKTKASKGGDGNFEKAPAGSHPAVCVGMFDLGTQENDFQGNVTLQHRIFFVWELVTEKNQAGKNFLIGLDLNVSLNEKATLRKWIESRMGKQLPDGAEYDVGEELGKPCLLNVVEKNGYPKITGMSSIPKGFAVPAPTFPPTAVTLDEYRDGAEIPAWCPWSYGEPLSEIIKRCEEFKDGGGQAPKPANPPAVTNQANKPAPPRAPKPPQSQTDRKFWAAVSESEVVEFQESRAKDFLTTKGLDPATILVTPDGVDAWKPAKDYGFDVLF
jgi:hypothetical protein